MEGDALAQLERVGELVVRDGPALGQVGGGLVGLEGDEGQATADAVDGHPVTEGGVEGRVVHRAGAVDGEGQGATGLGGAGAVAVVGGDAAGGEQTGQAGAHAEDRGAADQGAAGDCRVTDFHGVHSEGWY